MILKVREKGGSKGPGKEGKAREKKVRRRTCLESQSRNFQDGGNGLPELNTFPPSSK